VFLASDPGVTPTALFHNLKHNRVLHERLVFLTVRTADVPRVPEEERLDIAPLGADVIRVVAAFGFVETPDVPGALALGRRAGLDFDIMSTSFFLGRRTVTAAKRSAMPPWQHRLFGLLWRNGVSATDFFRIPPERVVELGSQVAV